MTFSATLIDLSNGIGSRSYKLLVTDGVSQKSQRTYTRDSATNADVEADARAEVARLTEVAASKTSITYKVGDQVDLTPPAPPATLPPSAQDIFLANFRQLQALLRASTAGFIDPADKRITDLQTLLKTAWLDSYIGVI